MLTRREASLIVIFVNNGSNRALLKTKVTAEKKKYKADGLESTIHAALLTLVAKAEAGCALGPAGPDSVDAP